MAALFCSDILLPSFCEFFSKLCFYSCIYCKYCNAKLSLHYYESKCVSLRWFYVKENGVE